MPSATEPAGDVDSSTHRPRAGDRRRRLSSCLCRSQITAVISQASTTWEQLGAVASTVQKCVCGGEATGFLPSLPRKSSPLQFGSVIDYHIARRNVIDGEKRRIL